MGVSPRWAAVGVLAATAVLFLARLGDRAVVSEEARWATAAREMRTSGDYLHPTINARPYSDKPAGTYWPVVAASHLTGGVDEWAARLPAAAAGLVGVAAVMSLGRRLYDARTGVLAGAVLATSWGFAFYSRRATADAETATGVLLAVWLFDRCGGRGGPWVVGLWLLLAGVSLLKGLPGFALPVAVFLVYSLWTARVEWEPVAACLGWLLTPWTLLAVPLAVGLFLLPFLLAGGTDGGLAMVWRENVRRFVNPHNHVGPVYLYVPAVVVLAAPWGLFLPAALVPAAGPASRGDRLAQAYFWAVFVVFTLSASRRSYYLLPVLPAVALLAARVLTAHELRPTARRLRTVGWRLAAVGAVGLGLGLVPPGWVLPGRLGELPPLPARGVIAAGWGLAVAAVLLAWRGWVRPLGPLVGGAFAVLGYVHLLALPAADTLRTSRPFVRAVRDRVATEGGQLALFRARDVVFDLGRPAPEFLTPEALADGLRSGQVRWVLAPRGHVQGLPLAATVVAEEPGRPWEGPDQHGDKLLLLEAAGY